MPTTTRKHDSGDKSLIACDTVQIRVTQDELMEELERAIIGDYVSAEAVQDCEDKYTKSVTEGTLTERDKFVYGWHLVKSQYRNDIKEGIKIMGELCRDGVDQRDYFYYMAMGYYKLEDYQEAESCVDRILNMEPTNHQAKELKTLIEQKMKRDGLITAGLVAGGAALVGAVAVGAIALLGAGIAKAASKR